MKVNVLKKNNVHVHKNMILYVEMMEKLITIFVTFNAHKYNRNIEVNA